MRTPHIDKQGYQNSTLDRRVSIRSNNMAYSSRTHTSKTAQHLRVFCCVMSLLGPTNDRIGIKQGHHTNKYANTKQTKEHGHYITSNQATKHTHSFTQRRKMVLRALDQTGAALHCFGRPHYPDPQPPSTLSKSLGYCQHSPSYR